MWMILKDFGGCWEKKFFIIMVAWILEHSFLMPNISTSRFSANHALRRSWSPFCMYLAIGMNASPFEDCGAGPFSGDAEQSRVIAAAEMARASMLSENLLI